MRENERTRTLASASMIVVLALMAGSAFAQVTAKNDTVFVLPGPDPVSIRVGLLTNNDDGEPQTLSYTGPLHGDLTVLPGTLLYQPGEDFWVLGTDSFTYTADGSTATVLLVAELHGAVGRFADYESGFGEMRVPPGSGTAVLPEAAIGGEQGMRAHFDEYNPVPSYVIGDPENGDSDGQQNGGDDGGATQTAIMGPDDVGNKLPLGGTADILSIGPELGPAGIVVSWLEVTETAEPAISIEAPGLSAPVTVPMTGEGAHSILIDWWKKPFPDGLLLVVDGAHSLLLTDIGIDDVAMEEYHFGVLAVDPTVSTYLDFDNTVVLAGNKFTTPVSAPLLVEGFEGDLSAWSNGQEARVGLTPSAAQTGSRGLEVGVPAGGEGYLVHRLPAALDRYDVRFAFDPNSTWLGTQSLAIFAGYSNTGATGASEILLRVKAQGGAYRIRAEHGVFGRTRWVSMADAPQIIELQWRAATGSESKDGRLSLWVDGLFAAELTDLQNHGRTLQAIRFGAAGAGGAVTGSFYLDNFESWQSSAMLSQMSSRQ